MVRRKATCWICFGKRTRWAGIAIVSGATHTHTRELKGRTCSSEIFIICLDNNLADKQLWIFILKPDSNTDLGENYGKCEHDRIVKKVGVDSGAARSVLPKRLCTDYPTIQPNDNKTGVIF